MKLAQDAAAQELKTICESRFSLARQPYSGDFRAQGAVVAGAAVVAGVGAAVVAGAGVDVVTGAAVVVTVVMPNSFWMLQGAWAAATSAAVDVAPAVKRICTMSESSCQTARVSMSTLSPS
mmetsp:Transcript_59587/g.142114  ORF Transcript_59587/g.142114 Transcript_59587/m.142114 type:complete len:121 (-) Transcript_59587:498-860(-)